MAEATDSSLIIMLLLILVPVVVVVVLVLGIFLTEKNKDSKNADKIR